MAKKNNEEKYEEKYEEKTKRKLRTKKLVKLPNSILKIHQDKMNEFNKIPTEKKLKELNNLIYKNVNEISVLKKECALIYVNNRDDGLPSDFMIKISHLEEENKTIHEEIEYIKSGKKEIDYTLNTCRLINDYISLQDKEKDIIIKDNDNIEEELYYINQEKNNINNKYAKMFDPNYREDTAIEVERCNICNILLIYCGGGLVCEDCGVVTKGIHQSETLSYKERQEVDIIFHFMYKKETHLMDWLNRFTSRDSNVISQEILDKVILEAHKERVKDLNTLTELQVKKYLKKLELNEYYDNVISIINKINKRPPFVLTTELECKIKKMFSQIQEPFKKYKEASRKNMLSYSYLLHHFFLILGLPEFSKYFFLLKSHEKLRQQDQTFKKIVEELAKTDPSTPWKFYPSI